MQSTEKFDLESPLSPTLLNKALYTTIPMGDIKLQYGIKRIFSNINF